MSTPKKTKTSKEIPKPKGKNKAPQSNTVKPNKNIAAQSGDGGI